MQGIIPADPAAVNAVPSSTIATMGDIQVSGTVRDRSTLLRRALWLSAFSVAWSGAVGLIGAVVALSTSTLSLLGFSVDAVIDAAASVALIWRFRIEAGRPERASAVEKAAERVLGSALIVLAVYLAVGAFRALASQPHPDASTTGVAILVASIVVLPGLARAKHLVARELGSAALRLDSILTGVAGLLALISLLSLVAAQAVGLWWADAAAALVAAAILGREGFSSLAASRSSA
jgi:divalent metal cation (Fe/Co/Zn/Cd) transporter